jgi:hypothetical protein
MIQKILSTVSNLLSNGIEPKPRMIYAVNGGDYLGEFFVFMAAQGNEYHFLSLPKMSLRKVPKDKFVSAIDGKVLELVEKLPADTYKVCRSQYENIIN